MTASGSAASAVAAPTRSKGLAWRFLTSLAVFGVLTTLWALPVVIHLDSRLLGGPADATSGIRDYWSIAHQGGNPFTFKHDNSVAAPEGLNLAPGTEIANAVQPAFIWSLKDVVGLVAAWNLWVLAGIALTGAATFTLLTSLGLRTLAAAFGAYAFAFSGYLIDKAYAGHGGLVQAWVFPLLLLALFRAKERRSYRAAAAAGLVAAVAFYIHTYYGAFALFLLVGFFAVTAIRERRENSPGIWPARLAASLGTLVVILLPALAAVRHFRSAGENSGSHPLGSLQQFGARIPAFFAPTTWSPLGHLIPNGLESRLVASGEPSLFFGFTTLALAVVWLVTLRRGASIDPGRRFVTWFAVLLVAAAFVFSLPREFAIGPVHLPAPSWFIGHVTTTLRVYARFGILVGLGLVILAALAVDRIEQLRGRRWALACLVLLALELTPTVPAKAWVANDPPASDRWLAEHPGGEVAIYPLAGDEKAAQDLNREEYYFQRFHGHPLFSTVEASMPKQAVALRLVAQYFTDSWTPHLLAAEKVRYVVVRTDVYRTLGQALPVLDPKSFRLLATLTDARIYRLLAAPLDIPAFFRGHGSELAAAAGERIPADKFDRGFYSPEQYKYNTPWRWLQQDGELTVEPSEGTTTLELTAFAFSNGQPRKLQVFGPGHRLLGSAEIATSQTSITIGPFDVKPGTTSLTFHVTPGPQVLGAADPRVASIYLSQPLVQPILKFAG